MTKINNIKINSNNKKEEELKMEKIKMVEEIILKEMANVMERYTIIKRENFDKIKELKKIQETILHSIEKIYDTRVKLNVSDEELGENFDRMYFSLQLISFDVDRELEKEIKKITEDKKEEEQKMEKENIKMVEETRKEKEQRMEDKINKELQSAGIKMNEIREMINSLDDEMKKKFNSYIEQQEKFVQVEKRKRQFLKLKMEILKDALENVKKEMEKNNAEDVNLSTDTQMKIYYAERRYEDVCAKHTNSYIKIKHTENIIKEERRREEEERRRG